MQHIRAVYDSHHIHIMSWFPSGRWRGWWWSDSEVRQLSSQRPSFKHGVSTCVSTTAADIFRRHQEIFLPSLWRNRTRYFLTKRVLCQKPNQEINTASSQTYKLRSCYITKVKFERICRNGDCQQLFWQMGCKTFFPPEVRSLRAHSEISATCDHIISAACAQMCPGPRWRTAPSQQNKKNRQNGLHTVRFLQYPQTPLQNRAILRDVAWGGNLKTWHYFATVNSQSSVTSCKFSIKCKTGNCLFPCIKYQFVTALLNL